MPTALRHPQGAVSTAASYLGVTTVTDVTDGVLHTLFRSEQGGHEQVVLCQDRATGLKAVIAIHSTALGPALGGTRFYPYATEEEAVADALNLSRGMSYKNAMAGLDHGGGKAVIIGDPETIKTEELLLAYGRFVDSLGGRYVTACDVGTYVADMDVVAREMPLGHRPLPRERRRRRLLRPHRLRRLPGHAGLRPAPVGRPDAARPQGRHRGRRQGRPPPGRAPAGGRRRGRDHRRARGVRTPDPRQAPGKVTAVADTDALIRTEGLDIYAPCALGGALNDDTVPVLTAKVVCGAANNQLAHPGVEKDLADRGILYAPDYVVNAGGVIQVADELHGFDFDRCKAKAAKIFDTTLAIFARAKEDGIPPAAAADRIAEQRMAEARAPLIRPRGRLGPAGRGDERTHARSAGRPPRRG